MCVCGCLKCVPRFFIFFYVLFLLHFFFLLPSSPPSFCIHGCPIISLLRVEKHILFSLTWLCYLVSDKLTTFIYVYFWPISSIPCISACIFHHYAILTTIASNRLETGWCEFFNIVAFLQYFVGYSGSFGFPCKLSNQFVDIEKEGIYFKYIQLMYSTGQVNYIIDFLPD